jgi:hypothetical protein
MLMSHDLLRSDDAAAPQHVFRATGDAAQFRQQGRRFLGPQIDAPAAVMGGAA